jgi:hypothetical protein
VHARERMIRERFTEHACAHCGSHYLPESVVVLARRRSAWMVMAGCPRCERRALFVVSFPDVPHSGASDLPAEQPKVFPNTFLPAPHTFDPEPHASSDLSPAPPTTAPQAPLPITQADVAAMHQFLDHFDGDFRALFRGRMGWSDDRHSS